MTSEKLQEILELHKKWLNNELDGKHADLSGANLTGADLTGADLRLVDLFGADLTGVNLRGADLTGVNLRGANLRGANLKYADLTGADLIGADLIGADLTGVNLRGADLRRADLRRVNLEGIIVDGETKGYHLACPVEGEFVCYKKVYGKFETPLSFRKSFFIVKMLVPAHAKRSSATTNKCRASEVLVLEILDIDGNATQLKSVQNDNQMGATYTISETIFPHKFDDNRWNECAGGIHFFMTFEEARNYIV